MGRTKTQNGKHVDYVTMLPLSHNGSPHLVLRRHAYHNEKGEAAALNGYLSSSRIPSSIITDPTSHRKLLVLDLNGTLIHRPKLRPGQKHSTANLRPAHPRPYMPSLCRYIDHPKTKSWLDVMVWSSAQPHSVEDMVKKAFSGLSEEHFLAVWARDTFGLTPEKYRMSHSLASLVLTFDLQFAEQKVLTIKDLNVIWKAFPQHSSSSTVLLDDSPRKAQLQPWNHIVLQEYVTKMRSNDLAVWERLRVVVPGKKHKKKEAKRLAKEEAAGMPPATVPSSLKDRLVETISVIGSPDTSARPTEIVASDTDDPLTTVLVYDETLLAIIGILEALKTQTNVSYWLREGGLGLASPEYPAETVAGSGPVFWFHDADVVQGWVDRGRQTLEELDIELEPGISG